MNMQLKIKEYQDKCNARILTQTYVDWCDMAELATKKIGKFSCYISNGLSYDTPEEDAIWVFILEELKKLYGDKTPKFYEFVGNICNGGLFFFDSEYEMMEFYHIFAQPLTDSSAVYACTFCPINGCMTENT